MLCLSHGQASVERGFSVNKMCCDDNLSQLALIARRTICDHVRVQGGVEHVNLTKELLLSCSSARKKFSDYLMTQKQDDISDKRKREEEKAILMEKRAKLEADFQNLQEKIDALD